MSFADCSSTTTSTSCDSIPMKVEIKVGVQYRFDHLVGDHARINPMRSVRPKASVVGAASGAASPSAVTIPGVKPPSSTAHLPHDLADMVHSFKDRDPFYPPEKLYKMIEPLADDFLALVRPALRMETHRRVLQRREAVLFLNKFPFTENHGVITSSESYYVSMPDITPTQIYDTLAVSCEFLRLCTAPGAPPSSPDADRAPPAPELFWWPSIVWNYMPSSAGSIIHPHMQCFCETTAPPAAAALMAATARWAQKHGSSSGNTSAAGTAALTTYHDALITRERALLAANAAAAVLAANETKTDSAATAVSWPERSRFVGEVDGVVVIAPFAPRTNRELHICVPGVSSLVQLGDSPALLRSVSRAIVTAVRMYHEMGIGAFNMATFSAPVIANAHTGAEASADSRIDSATGIPASAVAAQTVVFKMWTRSFPSAIYTNDCGPTELHYDLRVVETMPEVYAEDMRAMWTKCLPDESEVDAE